MYSQFFLPMKEFYIKNMPPREVKPEDNDWCEYGYLSPPFFRVYLAQTYRYDELQHLHQINESCGPYANDVLTYQNYRKESDPYNVESFKKWFPDNVGFDFLDKNRDCIYTASGINLLKRRYLKSCEPIQYAMLRFAKLLTARNGTLTSIPELRCAYELLSMGMLQASSILVYEGGEGDACRLYVAKDSYDVELIKQLNEIELTICMGIGVGYGVQTLPLHGSGEVGKIKNGFHSLMEKLNSCRLVSLHERTPKIAVYIPIYNDTVPTALLMKRPHDGLKNVFPALMINDYFMQCVIEDQPWYLFPGNLKTMGRSLHDCEDPISFQIMYNYMVDLGLYTMKTTARKLMDEIVESYRTSSGVYIVFSDTLNRYQNTKQLGRVKTLNLCAEITNYTTSDEPSSCTLMSANFACFHSYISGGGLYHFLVKEYNIDVSEYAVYNSEIPEEDRLPRYVLEYAFILGFMATILLNNRIGTRRNREIGVSPMGMIDVAIHLDINPITVCEILSEMLYKGCIVGSLEYSKKYNVVCDRFAGSEFSKGRPQWMLRDVKPNTTKWEFICERMKTESMANSALTAQAPTASTSLLTGVTESILLPMDDQFLRSSENGRHKTFSYGKECRRMLHKSDVTVADIPRERKIDTQLELYRVSAPYVDQSQSATFFVPLDRQKIFNLIMKTYDADLKTGIYYLHSYQQNQTLNIIRRTEDDNKAKNDDDTYNDSNCTACEA